MKNRLGMVDGGVNRSVVFGGASAMGNGSGRIGRRVGALDFFHNTIGVRVALYQPQGRGSSHVGMLF